VSPCGAVKRIVVFHEVVVDVGAGNGVLSYFAAKAGAKKVYAIEASGVAPYLEKNLKKNGVGDTVQVLNSMAEQTSIPGGKVDIIISEPFGYFAVFERMIESVLFVRDKWLKKGGRIFPSQARLYVGLSNNIANFIASRQNYEYYMHDKNDELHGYNVEDYGTEALRLDLRTPQIKGYSGDIQARYLVAVRGRRLSAAGMAECGVECRGQRSRSFYSY